MSCIRNKVFDLVTNGKFQKWVQDELPLREFCAVSELELIEEAASIVRLLESQKTAFSKQAIERNYDVVLNRILFE